MPSVNVNYKIIGLNVNEYRLTLKMTQEQLAEQSGVSKQFVSNIERGRAVPSLRTLLSLCDALHVLPNDLLCRAYTHDSDAPCTLREEHHVFTDTLCDRLFSEEPKEYRINPEDLPAFDIMLSDDDSEELSPFSSL